MASPGKCENGCVADRFRISKRRRLLGGARRRSRNTEARFDDERATGDQEVERQRKSKKCWQGRLELEISKVGRGEAGGEWACLAVTQFGLDLFTARARGKGIPDNAAPDPFSSALFPGICSLVGPSSPHCYCRHEALNGTAVGSGSRDPGSACSYGFRPQRPGQTQGSGGREWERLDADCKSWIGRGGWILDERTTLR